MRSRPRFYLHLALTCLALLSPAKQTSAEETSSCATPDWFAVQQAYTRGENLSPLCKAELDAAADHRSVAEQELNAIIHRSPQSADAYAAHSTLTHFYLRIGRFHDAEAQILAMLAAKPNAPDLKNIQSLFALLAAYPNLTVASSKSATVPTHTIDGNLFAPVIVNGSSTAYMLDTGINLSIMSDSEAARLGLKPQSSTTRLNDISGRDGPELRVVEVDDLTVGATHLRHVPFLVVADTNGAFINIPADQHAILGIQPLIALGTLAFQSGETLSIATKAAPGMKNAPLLFDGAMPLTQIIYQGKPLTVTFDMGATQTTLNPPFARLYPDLLKTGTQQSHTMNGLSGSTAQNSVSLPHLSLNFGREVTLAPATILLNETGGATAWTGANLGYDLMQQARPFTINFRRMEIDFAPPH